LTENDKLAKWFSELRVDDLREGGIIKFDMQDGTYEELGIYMGRRRKWPVCSQWKLLGSVSYRRGNESKTVESTPLLSTIIQNPRITVTNN
jgi:hypothetical protein